MSSNNIAIKVENISKCYRIGVKENMYDSIGGAIFDFIKSPLKNYRKYSSLYKFDDVNPDSNSPDIIWALRNVSFEVQKGEAVGIIGKNGAGKSTILKILSRITCPTSGYAEIHGRVSSLLEVGTGFHPELTGRENIYLNGTILGMTKKEIDRKYDEIVDFSGVEKFIDTPVKRYSSGMKVRLAFSVAAHLEPEILIIDEVLAVGDADFQKKSLGKMEGMAKGGRTVLFVSHNMSAIHSLCSSVKLLEDGQLVTQGRPDQVIANYLQKAQSLVDLTSLDKRVDRSGNGAIRFTGVRLYDQEGKEIAVAQTGNYFVIGLEYVRREQNNLSCVFRLAFKGMLGQSLFMCLSRSSHNEPMKLHNSGEIRCHIPKLPLLPGRYTCSITCKLGEVIADAIDDVFVFDVVGGDFFKTGILPPNDGGDITVDHSWVVHYC